MEQLDRALVELPVGDPASVRAPAERVPQVELLLVDPVGRSVDDRLAAVAGERSLLARIEIGQIQVVVSHEGDVPCVG